MKSMSQRSAISALAASCVLLYSTGAVAIEPIPEETGWSGYVFLGAGFTDIKSNTVVGNDIVDIGDETITDIFQSPTSDDTTHPAFGLELKYTLPGRNQIFLGSSQEDQLTMDYANQLGWRKQTNSSGTVQLSFLFSDPAIEVWEDPYLAGVPRTEVDRESEGFRFEWDSVLGSNFGILVQARDIEIDPERSGSDPALACDLACQALLDRNGDQFVARLSYRFFLAPNQIFEPQLRFRQEDRDGDAISRDFVGVHLAYTYFQAPWTFVGNVLFGQSEYDQPNPLYGLRQDADTMLFDATLLYALPTKSGRWQLTGSVIIGEYDSDITFHDSELTQMAVGFIYNFGGSGAGGN